MTQSELADASGVDQPNISAIENGRRMPTAETFERLVLACGFELAASAGDETIFVRPGPGPAPPMPPMTIDDHRRALVAVLEVSDAIVRSR